MSVGRTVAALAVALCFGGIVAALAQPGKEIGVVFAMVAAFVGGLIVFPVHAGFYTDASFEAEGGSVGRCSGILPLAQLVYYRFADETFADLFYFASCND